MLNNTLILSTTKISQFHISDQFKLTIENLTNKINTANAEFANSGIINIKHDNSSDSDHSVEDEQQSQSEQNPHNSQNNSQPSSRENSRDNSPSHQSSATTSNMTDTVFRIKDCITGIPLYKGEEKELDSFISMVDLYMSLALDTQKPTILTIVKAKLTGDVLQKIGTVESFATWDALKAGLRQHIKPLSSFAGAQEAIITCKQKKTENVRQYGARMKTLLEEINNTAHLKNRRLK